MDINKIKAIKKQTEASKGIVAKERDILSKILEDLQEIESNFTQGEYALGVAIEELELAIEGFSEIL